MLKDVKATITQRIAESREPEGPRAYRVRHWLMLSGLVAVGLGMTVRAAWLQTEQKEFLQDQGDARHVRVVKKTAHRGLIVDRHGQALAISTPVDSVWAIPKRLAVAREHWPRLAKVLGIEPSRLRRVVAERIDRQFVYLRRHVPPDVAQAVRELELPGVYLQREYRRYYPAGEVASHVIGFTNIDDRGQEGLELAFNDWLTGHDGAKQVIQDRLGRVVEDVASVKKARPGRELVTSLDLRIQTLAYRTLKQAVRRHGAKGGSAVVLDARTGEILAMVNQPSYNPNKRGSRKGAAARNRAVTDVIEPGSTVKPFTVAAALEARSLHADSPIDTRPGKLKVGKHTISDPRNLGMINVATVLKRSSNVGASKIALLTPPESLWSVFSGVGFGEMTVSAFPGESAGILARSPRWPELERATLAFGYGLSVTPLQLARAYAVLANDGLLMPVTFQPRRQRNDLGFLRQVDLSDDERRVARDLPVVERSPGNRWTTLGRLSGEADEANSNPLNRGFIRPLYRWSSGAPEDGAQGSGESAVPAGRQVLSAIVAKHVVRMLEAVVSPDGTGHRAQVFGYRVAGKTGTARKSARGGYSEDRYLALFAGIAPASDPRLAMVVVIDEPNGKEYYGGQVAAPVFSKVIAGALRLLRVPPDDTTVIANRIDLTSATLEPDSRPFLPPSLVPATPDARESAQASNKGGRG